MTDRLARYLRPFARVEPGESGTVLLLMITLFLLLTSYYILKTVREPLILVSGGAEVKSYTAAAQALLLVVVVPLYSAFVNRVGRVRLINRIGLFFVANIVGFYVLARMQVPYLGVPFFIWVGIFSLMVIAQLWSFANDLYTPDQGKRLFPLIAVGSSVGAIAGAWVTGMLLKAGVGVYEMMLVAAACLLGCVGLTAVVQRRERRRIAEIGAATPPAAGGDSGFTLVARDRYLLMLGLLLLLLNTVNTTGEYILGHTVRQAATAALPGGSVEQLNAFVGQFYADFFTGVNILGAVLQLFLVSRIMARCGVSGALLVLPVIALGGYAVLAAAPALLLIRLVKTLENATDYSLHNTVRHALFLPTSPEAKYKAKQAIDTFFVRMGDVVSAGLVLLGTTIGLTTPQFALVAVLLVLVWLLLALAIGRRYRQLAAVVTVAALCAATPASAAEAPADTTRGPVPLTVLRGTSELPGRQGNVLQHAGHWLLVPPYYVLAAVSWPIEQAAALNEKHHLASRLTRLLVWRLDPIETDIALTFKYDSHSGLGAVGVRTRTDDWLGTGARQDLAAAYLNPDENNLAARWSAARGPWRANVSGKLERRWRQSFYGFGSATDVADESLANRRLQGAEVAVGWRGLALDAYLRHVSMRHPGDEGVPVEETFPTQWEQARESEYASAEVSWTWDRRDDGEFSQHGTYVRVLGGANAARTAGDADYRHYGVHGQGYLDLRHGRTLATRAWVEAIDASDLDLIPYTEWPTLGGSQLMRGYATHRFTDATALLLSLEYRWPVFDVVTARLFCDWGTIAPAWSQLQANRIDPAYGLALVARLHGKHSLAMQVAHGEEWELYLGTGATFSAPDRRQR